MTGEIKTTLKLAGIGFALGVGAILREIPQSIHASPADSTPTYGEFSAVETKDAGSTVDADSSEDSHDSITSEGLQIPCSNQRLRTVVLNIVKLTRPPERHRPDSRGPPREEADLSPSGRRSLPATTLIFTLTHKSEWNPCL